MRICRVVIFIYKRGRLGNVDFIVVVVCVCVWEISSVEYCFKLCYLRNKRGGVFIY